MTRSQSLHLSILWLHDFHICISQYITCAARCLGLFGFDMERQGGGIFNSRGILVRLFKLADTLID
jgi:hypothetical protein